MFGTRLPSVLIIMVCWLALSLIGCSKSRTATLDEPKPGASPQTSTAAPNPATTPDPQAVSFTSAQAPPRTDVCALLSGREIQKVQGEPVKEAKASGKSSGGLSVAQCFFTLPTFTNSISLAVTQRGDGPEARDPRGFWKEKFRGEENADKDRDRDREKGSDEEKESAPPLKIKGVGDEAFWTGSAVGGALYVLKGHAFVRVSIGGPGKQRTKIARSKALAQLVLKHL